MFLEVLAEVRKSLKLGLFLCLVAAIAGLAIAYVHQFTQPLIDQQLLEEKLRSFREVFSQAEEIIDETEKYLPEDPVIAEVNTVYQQDKLVGVIYTVEPVGYNGRIQLLAGFEITTPKITAIKILQQSETPGLGDQVQKSFFTDRFRNKGISQDLQVVNREPLQDNQILAITSATISSQAVTDGVNAARRHFKAHFCSEGGI